MGALNGGVHQKGHSTPAVVQRDREGAAPLPDSTGRY
jgi:hypothetical protein